jgi:hypothetical protein
MNEPLMGPRIKLERANHHLIELETAEREFFDANPCRIIFDTDTKPGHKLAKIVMEARPPEIMHVLAGEIIYQLRSALDQTAVAFARLSKGPTKPKKVYFPTGQNFSEFRSACVSITRIQKFCAKTGAPYTESGKPVGKLLHLDGDFRKAILRTKPYDGGNEVLRAVFIMANIDKHMELIAIATSGEMTGVSDFSFLGCNELIVGGPDNLNNGVLFCDLKPDGSIAPNNSNAKIHTSGQITLGDIGPTLSGKPLVPLIRSMVEEVGRVHKGFEDVLIDRGDMPQRIIYMGRIFNGYGGA